MSPKSFILNPPAFVINVVQSCMLHRYYERPLAHMSNGVLIRVEEIAHQLMGLKGNPHLLSC